MVSRGAVRPHPPPSDATEADVCPKWITTFVTNCYYSPVDINRYNAIELSISTTK